MTTTENDLSDIDHCHACGFDLGTHHPTCTTAYPNRPTHAAATAASHATETELVLATMYGYAREAIRAGRNTASAAELPTWFAREDAIVRSIGYLAAATKSDLGLIFDVARDLT